MESERFDARVVRFRWEIVPGPYVPGRRGAKPERFGLTGKVWVEPGGLARLDLEGKKVVATRQAEPAGLGWNRKAWVEPKGLAGT